ncbi:hypothetical protein [Pseudomonas sp. NyZ201]|uniref:hypothetical protein n=1 Tax=Pseudomonas sp. NyZ201 TaxID=3409857 RepID=UPI003CEBEA60
MSSKHNPTKTNYFDRAYAYLLSFDEISEETIDTHLHYWKTSKPKNLKQLFKTLLNHVKNRQSMPNTIGDIEKLKEILFNFDPHKVRKSYGSWEEIFDIVESTRLTETRLNRTESKSHWVIYCKAILSVADFLRPYRTIDDYQRFVDGFLTNEYSRLALPLLLKEEIFGFGFALACDFLKETGNSEFLKPDTHINDIARGLGITTSTTNYGVFKDVEAYCKAIGRPPYEVDKLFWLVGSGKFYLSGITIHSSKHEFIRLNT